MNKKKSQLKHAKKRAFERLGINLTKKLREEIRGKIKKQKDAKFLYRTSLRVSIWEVKHGDNIFRVVYDKKRKNIVTFLPTDDIEVQYEADT